MKGHQVSSSDLPLGALHHDCLVHALSSSSAPVVWTTPGVQFPFGSRAAALGRLGNLFPRAVAF